MAVSIHDRISAEMREQVRRYNMLWIPEPSRASSHHKNVTNHVEWLTKDMGAALANALVKGCPGYIFDITQTDIHCSENRRVYIHESVSII